MRPEYIHLKKLEEGNPINKLRDSFNHQNEAIIHFKEKPGIVFIGDSITNYWDLDSYFELGNQKRMVNRGIGNDRIQYVHYRFEADALQLQPDWIILSAGINNTKELDLDLSDAVCNNIRELITTHTTSMIDEAIHHGIRIAVTSLPPTNRDHLVSFKTRAELTKSVNTQLKNLAQTKDIPYIDYYSSLIEVKDDTDYLQHRLTDDGLHPHVLGYDKMADVLVKSLSTHYPIKLKKRPQSS